MQVNMTNKADNSMGALENVMQDDYNEATIAEFMAGVAAVTGKRSCPRS